jgi:RND family efflux transporter MFP subunit
MMREQLRALLVLPLVLVATAVSGQDAAEEAAVVEMAVVERTEMTSRLPLNGSVFSRNDVAVTAAVEGELDWVAEPGTRIQAGQPIARLDTGPLRLRREELTRLLEREAVNEAYQARLVERYEALRASQNVSAFQLDEAVSRRDTARMDMAILETRIRQLDDEIARSSVRARFNGLFAGRQKQAGEYVVPGDVIGRFVDLDKLEVRTAVPIAHQSRLAAGDRLEIALSGGGRREGVVRTLIPSGDPVSQTFELRIDLARTKDRSLDIMPGQLVKVELPLESRQAALVVPRDAVVVRREGSFVYRVNAASVAERVQVTVGAGKGNRVAVSGALKEGERIVVRGADRLQDGQKVRKQGQG